ETGTNHVGLGFVGTLCTPGAIAVTSAYINDPLMMSYTVAHEVGHNMGFHHSDRMWYKLKIRYAKLQMCSKRSTILYKISPKSIENCLMIALLNELDKYQCLLKKTEIERLFFTCGDGVADIGEDCDCGFEGNNRLIN
ncbi:hypothetical protein MXB_2985, partial [Myxobolus squamalis]